MNLKRIFSWVMSMSIIGGIALAQSVERFEHQPVDQYRQSIVHTEFDASDTHKVVSCYNVQSDNKIVQKTVSTDEGVEIYAFTEWNLKDDDAKGLIKFNSSAPGQMTSVKRLDIWATAGAYAEEDYYIMANDNSFNPTLFTVDLTTGELSETSVTCTGADGYPLQAFEMSYDVYGRVMYMLANSPFDPEGYNSALLTVDLSTGEQVYVDENMGRHFYTLAIDAEGVMYGVDGSGMLCKIDKSTGDITEVGSTGLRPFYRQSMDFDRETGIVYWVCSSTQRYGVLYTLDVKTATTQLLGVIGKDEQQVIGVHVPYSLYRHDAPSYVTNLTITPDAGGEKKATLTWTCPTTTIGGDPLESIECVEISRDGVLVATLDNTQPGQSMTWNDEVETASTYTYKVQVINSQGRGELRTVSAYIGHDLPAAVEDLRLVRTTENSITLSWNAVTTGCNGGYIDMPSLRYKVERVSDGKVLAEELSETTFVDTEITELNRYRYAITSYNVDGVGGVTHSGYIVNGPARTLPQFANFDINDETEPNLWSVADANGDGISYFWNYDENYNFGAYWYQTFSMSNANDWLISPPMRFEANTPYKVVVEAGVSSSDYTERFAIYLIQNYDLSTAMQVGENFEINSYDYYRVDIDSVPAGNYSVCVRCISDAVTSRYLAVYSVETALNGDGNIRGDVWDDSSRPVADVYVSLEGTEFGAYTDERGFFEIANVPGGNYTINSTKLGYKSKPQPIRVVALQDVNVELDVIKRKAYSISGNVMNEYNQPLSGVSIQLNGYNTYSATTAEDGSYSISNVYEAEDAYSIVASKDFYTPVEMSRSVRNSNLTIDVTLNDSILPPAFAQVDYADNNLKSVVEWSRPGIDEAVAVYSGEISYTFGASDGTFGTLIGVVCHEPIILKNIHWLLLNSIETVNVVILALDENGKLTGEELYVDGDAPNVKYDLTQYAFEYDVYAPYGCFIGLSTDAGFLDIVTAVNTEEKPFVPNFNAYIEDYLENAEFEYVETLGDDFRENFCLGYDGIKMATNDAPQVSYNVYRENAASMSEVVANAVDKMLCADDAWLTLPDGEYRYAVTAVYANNKESERAYTSTITLDKTSIEDVMANNFTITLSSDASQLLMNRVADKIMVYAMDGTTMVRAANTDVVSVANCSAGVYMVRAMVDGQWFIEKILIK